MNEVGLQGEGQEPRITSQDINRFYGETPRTDPQRHSQEVSLMAEAFKAPETARAVLEQKLGQLAEHLGYDSVAEMEGVLNVDRSLPADNAARAKMGLSEDNGVFFHSAMVERVLVEENDIARRGIFPVKEEDRLFWARAADGKLTTVRTNYPHLDHTMVAISDEGVQAGRVQSKGWGRNAEMILIQGEAEDTAGSIKHKFDEHTASSPLRLQIKKLVKSLKR